MSLSFFFLIAVAASPAAPAREAAPATEGVKHGTQAECESWYVGDYAPMATCMEADPNDPNTIEAMRVVAICNEAKNAAAKLDIELTAVSFQDGAAVRTCNFRNE